MILKLISWKSIIKPHKSRKEGVVLRYLYIVLGLLQLLIPVCVNAIPPHYVTLDRDQQVDYEPNPDDVLRIWLVDVGQGDELLIQLPDRYRYDPNPNDADPTLTEYIEVLIDGGSASSAEADNMLLFLQQRIPNARNIE